VPRYGRSDQRPIGARSRSSVVYYATPARLAALHLPNARVVPKPTRAPEKQPAPVQQLQPVSLMLTHTLPCRPGRLVRSEGPLKPIRDPISKLTRGAR
jgi:hypothetical protein